MYGSGILITTTTSTFHLNLPSPYLLQPPLLTTSLASSSVMSARILLTHLRPHPLPLSIGLGISSLFAAQSIFNTQQPSRLLLRCDAAPASSMLGGGYSRYEQDAKVPLTRQGKLNPSAVRQMSLGSISGEFV
jgi:hypothetical protein